MEGECTFLLAASNAEASAPASVQSPLSAFVGPLILGTLRAGPPACSARAALRLAQLTGCLRCFPQTLGNPLSDFRCLEGVSP